MEKENNYILMGIYLLATIFKVNHKGKVSLFIQMKVHIKDDLKMVLSLVMASFLLIEMIKIQIHIKVIFKMIKKMDLEKLIGNQDQNISGIF